MAADVFSELNRATDANDLPLAGAIWYFYDTGTSTPRNVYSNATLATSLGATVTADSGGKFGPIFFDAAHAYRAVLKDALGNQIKEIDPANAGIFSVLTDLASTTPGKGADLIGYDGGTTVGAELDTLNTNVTALQDAAERSVNVLDFGADPTGVADSYTAIMAAINSATYGPWPYIAPYYPSGPAVYFPAGKYRCDTTIQLKKSVKLYGDASGLPWESMATLYFPAGVTGIIIHAYNTIDATTEGSPTTGASGTTISGLAFKGISGTPDSYGGHGIWARTLALLENVYVETFSGNNFNITGTSGGGGADEGNPNIWRMICCSAEQADGHNLFVDGADSNAGICVGFSARYAGGSGVYDSSFLGNTYIGCHVNSSTGAAYKSDGVNARNLFLGCYVEGGSGDVDIVAPATWIGGLNGAAFTSGSTANMFYDGKLMIADGGVGTPSVAGSSDQTTGFYINNSGEIRFACSGNFRGAFKDYIKWSSAGTFFSLSGNYHELVQDEAAQDIIKAYATSNAYTGNGVASIVDTASGTGFNLFSGSNAGGQAFIVQGNGNVKNTNNSYGAISDRKLKQDIRDAKSQWDDIKAVRLRKFRMKADQAAGRQLGVIAQELEATSPGLVEDIPDRDEHGELTGESTKAVKYSVLYLKALGALQEAMARIEALEALVHA